MPSPGRTSGYPLGRSPRGPIGTKLLRSSWIGSGQKQRRNNKRELMSDNVMRMPARSLKEQFSRGSEAWKEQSDPIFRVLAGGNWWGFPFFSLSASRYFGDKETLGP